MLAVEGELRGQRDLSGGAQERPVEGEASEAVLRVFGGNKDRHSRWVSSQDQALPVNGSE